MEESDGGASGVEALDDGASSGEAAEVASSEGEAGGGDDTPSPENGPGDDSDEPERLGDFLGIDLFGADPEEQRAYYARREQRVQELIAVCMVEEGFEYIPAVRPIPDVAFEDFESEEFARERGFGITTSFGDDQAALFGGDDWTDPNQAIVDALSDSARQAYYDTLYQPPEPAGSETDPDTGEEVEIYEGGYGGGCSGQAYEEVYAFDSLDEIYEQLDVESMYERLEADPRVQAMSEEWSQCMGDRGYDYEDPEAMYESVYTDFQARLEEIVGSSGGFGFGFASSGDSASSGGFADPFEGLSDEEIEELMADMSPEELDDLFATAQREASKNVDQAALAALQDEERALAVVNAECSANMQQQIGELIKEYESVLIHENRALLEQYRDDRAG